MREPSHREVSGSGTAYLSRFRPFRARFQPQARASGTNAGGVVRTDVRRWSDREPVGVALKATAVGPFEQIGMLSVRVVRFGSRKVTSVTAPRKRIRTGRRLPTVTRSRR